MPVSLSPSMIQGVVVAIIVFLIQLLFLEFLVLANANMQREISDHCDFGGFTSIKMRSWQQLSEKPSDGVILTLSGGSDSSCTSNESESTKTAWYSEDGNEATSTVSSKVHTFSTGKWDKKPAIVNQFQGIIEIIGEIIPLLLVVAVASEAFMLVYLRNSQGGISGVVSSRVALLVIAYVVILFGGTVFEFAENAMQVFTSTAVSGTDRFRDIAQLLLSLIPLAYELLVLGILGWNTASAYRACLLYTSPSPRDRQKSRMPSSA